MGPKWKIANDENETRRIITSFSEPKTLRFLYSAWSRFNSLRIIIYDRPFFNINYWSLNILKSSKIGVKLALHEMESGIVHDINKKNHG